MMHLGTTSCFLKLTLLDTSDCVHIFSAFSTFHEKKATCTEEVGSGQHVNRQL